MRDVSVLVVSCDRYADCWSPWSIFWERYGLDASYPVYLLTESKKAPVGSVYTKELYAPGPMWSSMLKDACMELDTPYIFMMLDDQWLADKVQTEKIEECLDIMRKDATVGGIYLDRNLKMVCKHPPDYSEDSHFEELPIGMPYRLSAGPTLWNREFLISVLDPKENAWEFERAGSFREQCYTKKLLNVKTPLVNRLCGLDGAIAKGKWVPKLRKELAKQNVYVVLSDRPTTTAVDQMKKDLKSAVFNLNPKLIVQIQNTLRRG